MHQRLVTIASFDDTVRAALARNYLEEAGIPVVLTDEQAVATQWSLSNALGGIKLQVAAIDAERAEHLLEELRDLRDDPGPETAFTTPETAAELAEDRRAEADEQNPSNVLAERAMRATVWGLLFWPLQLYALILLLALWWSDTRVSPDRRWKVWVAVLCSLPLWGLVGFPLLLVAGVVDGWLADRPNWTPQRIVQFGQTVGVNFPNPADWDAGMADTPDGRAEYRDYGTRLKDQAFGLAITKYPPHVQHQAADKRLDEYVAVALQQRNGKQENARPLELAGRPGREVVVALPGKAARWQVFLADEIIYVLSVEGPRAEAHNRIAEKFLGSFRFE